MADHGPNTAAHSEAAERGLQSLRNLATVIYLLQAIGLVMGLTFLLVLELTLLIIMGVTFLIAVIMNYVKRGETVGTWLESHFQWQIRTFWFGLLWLGVGSILFFLMIGYPILVAAGIWLIYRVARGWSRLSNSKVMHT